MSDENDSWLKSTLGIDVSSVLGDLGSIATNDAGAPPQSDAGAPSNGNAQAPPAAGRPNQFAAPIDANVGGVVTIPEVTVVGDPKAGQAYQTGFNDGLTGKPTNRSKIEQSAPGPTIVAASYDEGFRDGQAKAAQDEIDKLPSIGPAPPPEKPEEEDDGTVGKVLGGLVDAGVELVKKVIEHEATHPPDIKNPNVGNPEGPVILIPKETLKELKKMAGMEDPDDGA